MSAAVTRIGPRKYQAWCEKCKDGLNDSSRANAQASADRHNTTKHRGMK